MKTKELYLPPHPPLTNQDIRGQSQPDQLALPTRFVLLSKSRDAAEVPIMPNSLIGKDMVKEAPHVVTDTAKKECHSKGDRKHGLQPSGREIEVLAGC
jgi:hypothetical protein